MEANLKYSCMRIHIESEKSVQILAPNSEREREHTVVFHTVCLCLTLSGCLLEWCPAVRMCLSAVYEFSVLIAVVIKDGNRR